MKTENGCIALIRFLFAVDCIDIAANCTAEGYPSHGSDFHLRAEQLWEQSYKDWTREAETYRDPVAYAAYQAQHRN